MDKLEWFKEKYENTLSEFEQVEIFNNYCDENGLEEKIYSMDEFNDVFSGYKPFDIFHMVWFKADDVDWTDKYFVITVYGFNTFNTPYEFIEDYIGDIYNNTHIWETKINIDEYIEEIYDSHFDLKPEDMDTDEFYDIVENAVYSNDFESDIVADIEKAVSEN